MTRRDETILGYLLGGIADEVLGTDARGWAQAALGALLCWTLMLAGCL